MNAVLYTDDLLPITVVNVHERLWLMLMDGMHVRLPVMERITAWSVRLKDVPELAELRTVTIYGERLRRGPYETLMLFTDDEEAALLLRSEFLPGQRHELQNHEAHAFAAGFLRALREFRE